MGQLAFYNVDVNHSENPFNYDLNDLDLDSFCLMLQRDLHEITAVSLLKLQEFLNLTPRRSIPPRSSLTIMCSLPGINHSLLPTGEQRKIS